MAELLVFKTDSFDTDSFVKGALEYSPDAIVLVLGFDRRIRVARAPGEDGGRVIELARFRSERLNSSLAPLLFLIDLASYSRLLVGLCARHRPRLCWIENAYAAAIASVLKRLGLCGGIVYLPGDWLVPEAGGGATLRQRLWGVVFAGADYLACRSSSLVLDSTSRITEARRRFWGRKIASKEALYAFNMEIKALAAATPGRSICFLGNLREDSGMEVVMASLARLRDRADIGLRIIGPAGGHDRARKMAEEFGVQAHVEITGFVDRQGLPEAVSGCFCGVNLITRPGSHSSYTIPGKIVHYLQFLLPVITTSGAGVIADSVARNGLGLVIRPTEDEFVEAALLLHSEQERFRADIARYIEGLPRVGFRELMEA